jgi:hypothetical protein
MARLWTFRARFALVCALAALHCGPNVIDGQGQVDAIVAVSVFTDSSHPLAPGFGGFNVALMGTAIPYRNQQLAAFALRLHPGWLRFPAGARSNAFDWTTGKSRQEWVDRFKGSTFFPVIQDALRVLEAKGGETVDDAFALASAAGAQGLIVCVNVFTDTPSSAKEFAAYAKRRGIKVLVWQLGNEPTFFPQFFGSGRDYAEKARPFAEAIKAADRDANVSLSLSLASIPDAKWDDALASFRPRYWDTLTYHQYPRVGAGVSGPELMAALNGVLSTTSTGYVVDRIVPRFGEMPVIITEANPGRDTVAGGGLGGTLYGGIWSSEYVLRLSSLPQVKHVGMHQLIGPAGIDVVNDHHDDALEAFAQGRTIDPSAYTYNFFLSAQAVPYSVALSAVNTASRVYRTTVSGGRAVPVSGGGAPIPAIHAQAYGRGAGYSIVVTNKGATAEQLSITVDGRPVQTSLDVETATGPDPLATNAVDRAVVHATATTALRVVNVPPYSVVRVTW